MSAKDVRNLHSQFFIYPECGHDAQEDSPEHHEGRGVRYIEDLGYTCAEPSQIICIECHTDGGELNENSEYGEYPCTTLRELEKP